MTQPPLDLANRHLDREQAQDLVENLQEMADSQAYQLVLARLEALRQQDQRLLVAELNSESIRVLQGRVRARSEDITLIADLIKEIKSAHLAEP